MKEAAAAAAVERTIKTLLITNLPKNQLNTISATMDGNRFREVPQSGFAAPALASPYPLSPPVTSTVHPPEEVRNKLAFSITRDEA